jgi:hypothetical protein
MLPTGFHDVTALMEVAPSTWRDVLDAAGEVTRMSGNQMTHEGLWQSLTTDAPGHELLDALDVIVELGTDAGRDLLQQAAEDQQVDLQANGEPARELAARVWIQSRTAATFAEVLVRARVNPHEAGDTRTYREFVGGSAPWRRSVDRQKVLDAVRKWCEENGESQAVEAYSYELDGEWRCEILRGAALKRVVEIRNGRPSILDFRPAAADHLRYDPETGRLGIATRAPRLLQMYRDALGALLANDVNFFSGEHICSLRPLQQHGRALFEQHRIPGVLHVDVVELRWRRGDRDKIWVRGRDCFQVLRDLGARLNEGELVEARLSISFAGGGRRGHVSVKVPNRIDIKAGANEALVERLLDEAGVRGVFGEDEEPRDLWSLHPWRMTERDWRRQVGGDFDRLLRQRTLRPAHLDASTHPDHPAAVGALDVEALDASTILGTSDDPAIGLRTLTSSDVAGYELDVDRVTGGMAAALGLEGAIAEIATGVWSLGRRSLSSTVTLAVFVALRRPSGESAGVIRDASKGARPVLLVPRGCSSENEIPQVTCFVPSGPYDGLVGAAVERLELQDEVAPPVWIRDDLILDPCRGTAWYRRVELTKLRMDTHPFTFAVAVAQAGGRLVKKEDLNALLSRARGDEDVAKKAKSDFIAAVKASFEAAGLECPTDVSQIFVSRPGGYALCSPARVLQGTGGLSVA